jgi:hypothetical protein
MTSPAENSAGSCTAVTVRGTRCRILPVLWPPGTSPVGEERCGTHLLSEQRVALDAAQRHAFPWIALYEDQRTQLHAGRLACWAWPTVRPSIGGQDEPLSARALDALLSAEGGKEALLLERW